MKVLYVAGRELSYSRTHNVYKALQKRGVEVKGCFPPDRSFKHYPALLLQVWKKRHDCDLVIVGFYGQLILPWVKLLTRKPVLFDMYIATFDTMVHDRGKGKPGSLKAWLYMQSDRLSCRLSRSIILETNDHIRDFAKKFSVPEEKFHRVFLAVDDSLIYPRPQQKRGKRFLVHFHGEYAPFHGVDTIIRAAALLRDKDIDFQIIGKGITYARDRRLAQELDCPHITFIDPVPYHDLATLMARADVCLGIFGGNERMLRVTTNKVIESIAMCKPLITGRNEPVQELLVHEQSALLIERANPQALADAILRLRQDPQLASRLAAGGYAVFQKQCTLDKLGEEFETVLKREMLS